MKSSITAEQATLSFLTTSKSELTAKTEFGVEVVINPKERSKFALIFTVLQELKLEYSSLLMLLYGYLGQSESRETYMNVACIQIAHGQSF